MICIDDLIPAHLLKSEMTQFLFESGMLRLFLPDGRPRAGLLGGFPSWMPWIDCSCPLRIASSEKRRPRGGKTSPVQAVNMGMSSIGELIFGYVFSRGRPAVGLFGPEKDVKGTIDYGFVERFGGGVSRV